MTNQRRFKVTFIDEGRTARSPANPAFPNGIDLDISSGKPSCKALLPYPAPRVGKLSIHCTKCNTITVVTVAGRTDDPRSVKIACPLKVN